MNCELCQSQLLSLLYEELGSVEAKEARAHLSGCAQCTASFEKLGAARRLVANFPLEDPDPALDAVLLAAARKHVAEQKRGHRDDESDGLWPRFLRFLGSFALGPQVAMATVMLLVVAIGLWYVPLRDRSPDSPGDTVVTNDHGGEAAPTIRPEPGFVEPPPPVVEPVPAANLDEQYEVTRGEGDRDDQDRVEQRPAGLARQSNDPAAGDDDRRPEDPEESTGGELEGQGEAGEVRDVPAVTEQRRRAERQPGRTRVAPETEGDTTPRGYAPRPSVEPPPPTPQIAQEREEAQQQATTVPAPAETPPPQGGDRQPSPGGSPAGDRGAYDRAVQRFQRADYEGAAQDLERFIARPAPDARTLIPSALHTLARSYRANGAYADAARRYEDLFRRFPSYGRAPEAMLELGDVYRRLGNISRAQQWYQRAAQNPRTAAAARRELARLETYPTDPTRPARRSVPDRAPSQPAQPAPAAPVEMEDAF